MSKRFEQPSLDGLDLDEQLAELPLQRTPRSPEDTPPADQESREAGSREQRSRRPKARGSKAARSAPPSGASAEHRGTSVTRASAGDLDRGELSADNLDLFEEPPVVSAEKPTDVVASSGDESGRTKAAAEWERPSLPERLLAGLADLTVHVGVLAAALLAMSSLGLVPSPDQWPGLATFLLCFSFLYHVVPLAFWGQTPGMAWRGLRAQDVGGESLSFGQSGVRWAGALLTGALAGLPALLALSGARSLTDRLSGSRTLRRIA